MEQLKGFEKAKVMTGESTQLPAGGYIAKVMSCKEIKGNGYSYLEFCIDIHEGEYKGHFAAIYRANSAENKKWKGVHREFIPQENSQYYEDNLTKFKTMTANFEESNKGYTWDWDESKLKDKLIGVVYGEEEFKPDDKDEIILITKPRHFTSVQRIKDNKFKIPKIKKLKGNTLTDGFSITADDDGDLPF